MAAVSPDSHKPAKERERASIIERLEARQANHKRDVDQRKIENPSTQFTNEFFVNVSSLQTRIDDSCDTSTSNDSKLAFEEISVQLLELEKAAAEASYFLPAYDQRSVSALLAKLKNNLEAAKKRWLPQKKFSFAKKRSDREPTSQVAKAQSTSIAATTSDPSSNCESSTGEFEDLFKGVNPRRTVRNRRQETVVLDRRELDGGDVVLADLHGCSVFLLASLPALWIVNVRECQVYGGPVQGATFVEGATGCTFMLTSAQVRVHKSHGCQLYLSTRSRPIIEDSIQLDFAPNAFNYTGQEQQDEDGGTSDLWQEVQDFGWLRAAKSPNWRVMPHEERMYPPSAPPRDVE